MSDISVAIVALPSNADQLPGSDEKHCTLQYLGKIGESAAPGLEDALPSLISAVSAAAALMEPFTLPVDRVGSLGEDGATVWFLNDDGGMMSALRDQTMSGEVQALVDAGSFTKHPAFIPHVTIGYNTGSAATSVVSEDVEEAKDVTEIPFHAIALWWGDERIVFPLGGLASVSVLRALETLAIIDVHGNWHHPDTGKFIRKPWEFELTLKTMFPDEVTSKLDSLLSNPLGTAKEDIYRLRKYLRELASSPDNAHLLDLSWGKVADFRDRYSLAALKAADIATGKQSEGLPTIESVDVVMDLIEEGLEFLETAWMYENVGLDETPGSQFLPFDPSDVYSLQGKSESESESESSYALEQNLVLAQENFLDLLAQVNRTRRGNDVFATSKAASTAKPLTGAKLSKLVSALSDLGDTSGARSAKSMAAKGSKSGLNSLVDTKIATLEKTSKSLETFLNTEPSDYNNPYAVDPERAAGAKKAAASKTPAERSAAATKAAETRAENRKTQKRAPAGASGGTGGQFVDDPDVAARNAGGITSAKGIKAALSAGDISKAQQIAEKYLSKVNKTLDQLHTITFAALASMKTSFAVVDRLGNWHSASTGKFIEKPWKVGLDLQLWAKENNEKIPRYLDRAISETYMIVSSDNADDLHKSGVKLEEAVDKFEDELPLSSDDVVVDLLNQLRDGALYLQRADWWPDLTVVEGPDGDSTSTPGVVGVEGLSFVKLSDGTEVYEPTGAIQRLQALIRQKVPGTWIGLTKARNQFLRAAAAGDLEAAQRYLREVDEILVYARDVNGLTDSLADPFISELEASIKDIADRLTPEDLPLMKSPGSATPQLELSRITKDMRVAIRYHDALLAQILVEELREVMTQLNPKSPEYAIAEKMIIRLNSLIGVTVGGPAGTRTENYATQHGIPVLASGAIQEVTMPEPIVLTKWEGPLGFEGQITGDNRMIAPGALSWADESFPQPMRWAAEDIGAHDGARVIGTIEGMTRYDSETEWNGQTLPVGTIFGWGTFDLDSDLGKDAQRHVIKKLSNGVSLDLDKVSAEMLDIAAAAGELGMALDDAIEDRPITLIRGARNRAATLVALPAFEGARIQATAKWTHETPVLDPERLHATLTALSTKSTATFAGIRIDAGGKWGITVPKKGYRWVDMPDAALEQLVDLVKQSQPDADARDEGVSLDDAMGDLPAVQADVQAAFDNPTRDVEKVINAQSRVQDLLDVFPFEDYADIEVKGWDDREGNGAMNIKDALEGFVAQDPDDVLDAVLAGEESPDEAKAPMDGDQPYTEDNLDPNEREDFETLDPNQRETYLTARTEGSGHSEALEAAGGGLGPSAVEEAANAGADESGSGPAERGVQRAQGEKVQTPDGPGTVTDVDAEGLVLVELDDGGDIREYPEMVLEGLDMGNEPSASSAPTSGADGDLGRAADAAAAEAQRIADSSSLEQKARFEELAKILVEIPNMDPNVAAAVANELRGGMGETPDMTMLLNKVKDIYADVDLAQFDDSIWEQAANFFDDYDPALAAELRQPSGNTPGSGTDAPAQEQGEGSGATAGNVSGPADDNASTAVDNPYAGKSPREIRQLIAAAEREKSVWQGGDTKEASERTKLNRALKDEDIKDLTAALPEGEPTTSREVLLKALKEDVDVPMLEEALGSLGDYGYMGDSDYRNKAQLLQKLAEKSGHAYGAPKDDGYQKVTDLGNGWTLTERNPKRTWGGDAIIKDDKGNEVMRREGTREYMKPEDALRAVGAHLYSAPKPVEGWQSVAPQYGGPGFLRKGSVLIYKNPGAGTYEIVQGGTQTRGEGIEYPTLEEAVGSVDGSDTGEVSSAPGATEQDTFPPAATDYTDWTPSELGQLYQEAEAKGDAEAMAAIEAELARQGTSIAEVLDELENLAVTAETFNWVEETGGLPGYIRESFPATFSACSVLLTSAIDRLSPEAGASPTTGDGSAGETLSAEHPSTLSVESLKAASVALGAWKSSPSAPFGLTLLTEEASRLAASAASLQELLTGSVATQSESQQSPHALGRSVSSDSLMTSMNTFSSQTAKVAAALREMELSSGESLAVTMSTTATSAPATEGSSAAVATLLSDSLKTILQFSDSWLTTLSDTSVQLNWVSDAGGLPTFVREIADALIAKGMDESRAIATAVNTIKRWARAGSAAKGQGGHVSAATVAKAQAALAEWEAKRAAAHATAVQADLVSKFGSAGILADIDPRRLSELVGQARVEVTDQGVRMIAADGTQVMPKTISASGASMTVSSIPPSGVSTTTLKNVVISSNPTMSNEYDRSLVASGAGKGALAAPIKPPAEWFADPKFRGAHPLTVTKDGRVFGHLALWGSCHTGVDGTCLTVPRSASDYALFHLGVVECEDGSEVAVGRLAMNTGHANDTYGSRKAIAHYENTGLAIADLRAGEDSHGIWVAGALRPDATPEQIRALKASPLSGDWRFNPATNSLDLVMALAVNQPGFAVPRPKFLVASGAVRTLTAAGMLAPAKVSKIKVARALAGDESAAADIRYLQKLAADARRAEAKQLKVKVLETTGARRKIQEMAASLALKTEES